MFLFIYTTKGYRHTLKYVKAPVPKMKWHTLRVEFFGSNIKVYLNETKLIDLEDNHIIGSGAVGLWTKADSITEFDNFSFKITKGLKK